jgi:hypothetical protein
LREKAADYDKREWCALMMPAKTAVSGTKAVGRKT